MDIYWVLMLIFSSLMVQINGNCEEKNFEMIPCSPEGCKMNDTFIMHSSSREKQNQSMSITSIDKNYYGALITESGNLTIDYASIIHRRCDGLYDFAGPESENSLGLTVEFFSLLKSFTNRYDEDIGCHPRRCDLVYYNEKSGFPFFEFNVLIKSNFSDCHDGKLSPKTLNLHFELWHLSVQLAVMKGLRMLIFVPTEEKFSTIQSDGEEPLILGVTDDLSSHPFVTIRAGVIKQTFVPKGAEEPNCHFSMKASDPKEVSVDLKSTNLPVACFFGGNASGKVYEVFIRFEIASRCTILDLIHISLTWTISISLGNPSNHLSKSSASATQASTTFLFIIFLLLTLLPLLNNIKKL